MSKKVNTKDEIEESIEPNEPQPENYTVADQRKDIRNKYGLELAQWYGDHIDNNSVRRGDKIAYTIPVKSDVITLEVGFNWDCSVTGIYVGSIPDVELPQDPSTITQWIIKELGGDDTSRMGELEEEVATLKREKTRFKERITQLEQQVLSLSEKNKEYTEEKWDKTVKAVNQLEYATDLILKLIKANKEEDC